MTTEFNQRRALGMRYGQDPAYLLEKQRLQEEYNLMMPRAQLAEQKRQFNSMAEMQKDSQRAKGMSGLIGTVGNLYAKNMWSNAMAPASTVASNLAWTPAGVGTTTLAPTLGVTPAATGLGVAEGTTGLGSTTLTPSMASGASGAGVGLGTVASGVGMGFLGGQIGKSGVGKDIGEAMLFGGGGEKEQSAVSGQLVGATGGYLAGVAGGLKAGATLGSALGAPGAIVGGIIGGIVGAVSSLIDSWICTATADEAYMTTEEKQKMNLLKIYAIKNHFGWWNSYLKHGVELTKAIKDKEKNLPEFYGSIRLILIEPIYKEESIEKCFQIYLAITQMLFKSYMPEFEFKEEE